MDIKRKKNSLNNYHVVTHSSYYYYQIIVDITTINLHNNDVLLGRKVAVGNDGLQQTLQEYIHYHLQDTGVKHFPDYQQSTKIK